MKDSVFRHFKDSRFVVLPLVLFFVVAGLLLYFSFVSHVKFSSTEILSSWLASERANIEQGNFFEAFARNRRIIVSSKIVQGVALVKDKNTTTPEVQMLFGNVPSIFPTKKGVEKVDDITFYSSGFLKGRIQYRFPQKSDYYIELSVNPVFLIKSFFAVLALLLVASLIFMATMSYLAVVERDKRLRIFDAAVDDLINNDIPSHYLSTAMPNIEKSWRAMKSKINSLQSEIVLQSKTLAKSEAISQTTQTIAHDLKGPLAIFQKIAFGTLQDYEHEKENLVKALNRLSSMADSIKRADLESQVRPYKSRLDLDETISSARSYAEKHSVILRSDAKSVEDLQIDLPKVERAVSNLLFNAIEAANSIVEISWLLEGAKLSILVKDDGDGVPNKLIPKLFTRGATHGKENGTGLGLAFVDHVAKGHGGKVQYQREGKTSMFKLVLEDVRVADEPQAVETLDRKSGKFLINREENFLILVKLKDSVEEQRLSNELATKLGVFISNDFGDLSNCHIFFTDDSSLLLKDYPENVRVIMNRPEKAETVLRGLFLTTASY